MSIKSICVYCGSSSGNSGIYKSAAQSLATTLVERGISLVYGGGNIGLMGAVADEVMRLGGEVTGVIPEALMKREVGHAGLTRLHVVRDMHERKAMMADLADGFIALPGGIGTLEELFETTTWSQLGLHDKPIGLLNVEGFYDGLIQFLGHLVAQGFLRREHADLMLHAEQPASLLELMQSYRPDQLNKWLDREAAGKLLP